MTVRSHQLRSEFVNVGFQVVLALTRTLCALMAFVWTRLRTITRRWQVMLVSRNHRHFKGHNRISLDYSNKENTMITDV